jgi:hypothetical protein
VAKRLVEHLERAGFVVMKRSPVPEGAAIARGFEGWRRKATREQDSSCAVERRSSSKANIPFADLPSRIRWKAEMGSQHAQSHDARHMGPDRVRHLLILAPSM